MNAMPEREALTAAATYGVDFAREKMAGKRVLALTGAGISTDSGIPDYRGAGRVARHPMTFDVFMGSKDAQIRYWARSFIGWNRIAEAQPNRGHFAIAQAESLGKVFQIVTQNVDNLHQKAGAKNVIDLHGRLDQVRCMTCAKSISRIDMDKMLAELNPEISRTGDFEFTPDGDAEVDASENFQIPVCQNCRGVLKPDVVFFGESVPTNTVELAMKRLDEAEVLLVAGTSLTVNSGLRFARRAARANKPIIIVNIGATKADELATAKIDASTSLVLERLLID
jgi:NAD-dependent SIR2 family protein deacetylase